MNQLVQVVIRQAGTAYAFAPILKKMETKGISFHIVCLSTHNASPVLKQFSLPHVVVKDFSEAERHLKKEATLLFTGTSEVITDDILYWRWGRKHGIRSIGYVDQWLHWWKRFTYPVNSKKFNEVPDEILVIDKYSYDEFVEEGCPKDKLHIVGNPALDDKITDKQFVPKKLLSNPYEILFVSEPYNMDREVPLDFDEEFAFYKLCETTENAAGDLAGNIQIKIRPHPLDKKEKIERFLKNAKERFPKLKIKIDTEEKMQSIRSSDCVIGLESILVFESYLMGRPSACFVPPEGEPNPYTRSASAIRLCRTEKELEKFLKDTFFQPKPLQLNPEHSRKSLPVFWEYLEKHLS